MRILVTGGAGYVGSVSLEARVEAGHKVICLDNMATTDGAADLAGADLVVGSYTDRELVAGLLEERSVDAVLHCGARSLVGESVADPALYFRENVAGGIALLEAMRDAGTNRLVISSTAAVYGVPESVPIDEDAPLRPINAYGETKRSLEAAASWFARAYGLRVVSVRYFNVAGASSRNGERHDPETHLIPNVLTAAHALRHRLRHAGRDSDPGLRPRPRPRGRPSARARGNGAGRRPYRCSAAPEPGQRHRVQRSPGAPRRRGRHRAPGAARLRGPACG